MLFAYLYYFFHISPPRVLLKVSLPHPKTTKNLTKWNQNKAVILTKTSLFFAFFISQVNGMDTVRIPVSLVPYEDPSASYQKQLKTRQNAGPDISEPAAAEEVSVKAVSEAEAGKDSVSRVSEASASAAEGTSTQTSEDTTAPPSDGPKKD